MKRTLLALAFITACTSPTAPSPNVIPAEDLTGSWTAADDWTAQLVQDGLAVTGTMGDGTDSRRVDGHWTSETTGSGTLAGFLVFRWVWIPEREVLEVRASEGGLLAESFGDRTLSFVREGS